MSDLVVSEGYAAVGYEYINVDDCWLEKNRGSNNELIADRKRFPSGMRSLAEYVSFSFKRMISLSVIISKRLLNINIQISYLTFTISLFNFKQAKLFLHDT